MAIAFSTLSLFAGNSLDIAVAKVIRTHANPETLTHQSVSLEPSALEPSAFCYITPDKPIPSEPTTPSVAIEVRIVRALVNPIGADPGKESVTLIKASLTPVNLRGWALTARLKCKHTLDETIEPGAVMTVPLSGTDIQPS